MNTRDLGLSVAAGALLLDQLSKLLLLFGFGFIGMTPDQTVSVLPFFNLVMVWNPGVSYGLFPAGGPLGTAVLLVVSVVAVIVLGFWLWKNTRRSLSCGICLIIGGAMGNVVDRLLYGKVADFFHFYGFGYS